MIPKVLMFVLIVGTDSIRWSSKLPPKPKELINRTGCYIKEVNDVIPFNDSVNALGFCYLIHCSLKQIDYVSCGVTSHDHDKCLVIEADFEAPYPECCPQVKCFQEDIPWDGVPRKTKTRTNMTNRIKRPYI